MNKSDELDLKSTIFYYFREKQYNSMLNKSKEGISKFKGDASFHLFHCLSLILANRLEEGIHSLETINMENEIKLAVTIALMYSHKLFGVSNKNLFLKLDGQMRDYRKDADAGDFYYSAFVLLCFNKSEKALDYAEKALAMQSSLSECLSLKGWILLYLYERGKRAAMNIKDVFEHALQLNPKNLDIIMGFTESCLLQNDSSKALEIINKAIVHHSATNLPLLQKLKIQLAAFEWDQVQETVNRINTIDSKNLYVKKISIIIKLCRLTNYEEAALDIENLSHLLDTVEPGNIQIVCEYSQLFSGICNKNVEILSQTTAMLVNALQNNPESLELIIELGYQALARGNSKEAARYFKSATKIDETSLKALLGLSMCEYNENGNSEQIRNQVQFLLEVKDAQENLLLKYIQAKISDTSETSLSYLKHICDVKLFQVKSYPYSDSYLLLLEVDFMLDVIRECFQHISVPQSVTDNIYEILNVITRACPGFSECLLLLAKLQYIKGDNTSAMNTLDKLLVETKNIPSEAQLLMAEIQVQHGLFDRAAQSLEVCVSHNFKVRENPIYHYVIALVDKNTNNYADAIKSLTTALSLMNTTCRVKYLCNISLLERSSIYIELVDVLSILGQSDEASKILEEAIEELKGTPEESRILLLSAEHLLMRKNVQGAIDILTRIKVTDSCYVKAKSKHAEVLLKYRKDKYAYLDCYHDFVDENPGPDSYILLADAYINVLEPDDALEYYDKALKTNPNDPTLISKMGKALVDTHYFFKAVNYYKEAIKKNNNPELKLQLAELYINLKDFEKGEIILLNELEVEKSIDSEDVTYVRYKVRLLNLLAQIQEKSGNVSYAIKNLKDAMDNQNRLCKRLNVDQSNENCNKFLCLISIVGFK